MSVEINSAAVSPGNYTYPIARAGEEQFACIVRNRSGIDAGRIDFGARFIRHLSESEQQDAIESVYSVYQKWCSETGKTSRRAAPASPSAAVDEQHARELIRAEEKGYQQGLRDANSMSFEEATR